MLQEDIMAMKEIKILKLETLIMLADQRWSQGHKARGQGQGHKTNPRPRPRTAHPRTDPLETKGRNARGQGRGHSRKCSPKKQKKKVIEKIFRRSPKKIFEKNFQTIYKSLANSKNSAVLEPNVLCFSAVARAK